MKAALKTAKPASVSSDCLVLAIGAKLALSPEAREVDAASAKRLSRLLANGDFDGALGSSLMLQGLDGIKAKRILLVGSGEAKKLDTKAAKSLIAAAAKAALASKAKDAHFALASLVVKGADFSWIAERLATELED